MSELSHDSSCSGYRKLRRRTFLKAAGSAGAGWLTGISEVLARDAEGRRAPAKSIILLWLQGGPSQLETFDPHPQSPISAGTKAIRTSVPSIQLAEGLEQTAEWMEHISLVRSVTSREGDHERATYNVQTGFRPDPTLVHPSIGAIACHQLPGNLEIPRHVSILPGPWPARGGYLGERYDAFRVGDPRFPIGDIAPRVANDRFQQRVNDLLQVVEPAFAQRRLRNLDSEKTLHRLTTQAALKMMSSDQLGAFDVSQAPREQQSRYGDSPFGRGCLAALRLIEAGVRCVEISLAGWDSHADNHTIQQKRVAELDPAFAALIRDLRQRDLLQHTLVFCGGEFGRTPHLNPLAGRDHWPHGFSIALAGGGIRGGRVIGETSPHPNPDPQVDRDTRLKDVANPHDIQDIHATLLHALGIDPAHELDTPVGRPMALSQGKVIPGLVSD